MYTFIRTHNKIIAFILLGFGIRLLFSLFFTQMVDFTNITALVRSVAETGNLIEGFKALNRLNFVVQLYGKIFYQVQALWLILLNQLNLVQIPFLLDTKPYSDSSSYLMGLWQWGPPHYKITLLKLIQFVWDIFFLIFMYLAARKINPKHAPLAILFWSLNPYFMMINFAFFMPDIFMLGCFVGGAYFWLRALDNKNKEFNADTFISLGFLVLGAVVKQLPLLAIPFLIISTNKTIRSFFAYIAAFVVMYLVFKQSWSSDSAFINKYFLFSHESMSILRTTFNGIPYFLYGYVLMIIFAFTKRAEIFSQQQNIFLLIVGIISFVYLNDTIFFIQFVIWILPFAFLYALYKKENYWLFTLCMVAMTLKGWSNEAYLSFILTPAIGSMFNDFIGNDYFINQHFNFDLYDLLFKFLVMFTFFLVFLESVYLLFKNKSFLSQEYTKYKLNIDLSKTILAVFILYFVFVGFDYFVKSRYILLPQNSVEITTDEIQVTNKPLVVAIRNPDGNKITALNLRAIRKGAAATGETTFDFYENGEIVLSQKVADIDIPDTTDESLILLLNKTLTNQNLQLHVYKSKGINNIFLTKVVPQDNINVPRNYLFRGYEQPDTNEIITLSFANQPFDISFHGVYEWEDIMRALKHHSNGMLKTYFYIGYISTAFILILVGLLLLYTYRDSEKSFLKKIFNR